MAIILLFLLSLFSLPNADPDAREAILSLGVCAAFAATSPLQQQPDMQKGLVCAVGASGIYAAWITLNNAGFAFARYQGYSDERIFYLILGAAVAAAVPILVLMALSQKALLIRAVAVGATLLLVVGLFNGLARIALISGVLAGLLAYCAWTRIHARLTYFIVVATAVLVVAAFSAPGIVAFIGDNNAWLSNRLLRLLDPYRELATGRGDEWTSALSLIVDEPMLGRGVLGAQTEIGIYPHNAILEAWVDLGLFGAVAMFVVYQRIAAGISDALSDRVPIYAAALYLSAMVYAIESLKSGSLYGLRALFIIGALAETAPLVLKHRRPVHG